MDETPADATPESLAPADATSSALPILVGVDGSDGSVAALRRARDLAQTLGTSLEIVTCWRYPAVMSRYDPIINPSFEELAKREQARVIDLVFGAEVPDWVRSTVVQGPAARVLIEASAHVGILVVGSRGYGGFKGLLLGSVGSACAAHAECDVLVVRDRG